MTTATVFNADPAAQARDFAAAGFHWLHVVDLDGSFAGSSVNSDTVREIRRSINLKMQLGGGIRERAAIDAWLDLGIDRVVLGTAALHDSELVRRAAADHPGRIVVDIGARGGRVAVQGWGELSDITPIELAHRFIDAGLAAIIYTDVGRDGAMSGVDVKATAAFAREVGIPVIASGGAASLADIAALKRHEQDGIIGVICGRALYDRRINPAEAFRLLAEAPRC
jgi:phosphoribosylformimino-5-aminoimidazole carboxamide ribotide isomerase